MTGRWVDGPLLAFDTETTGIDVDSDRIVTAAVILVEAAGAAPRRKVDVFTWLVNPGIPIPAEATAVHGITDEMAFEGEQPRAALPVIAGMLNAATLAGAPVVGFNACFDLSLLAAELDRHGLPGFNVGCVVDPLVIDRAVDKFRRGSRKLVDVAQHYGVPLGDDAHGAEADAHATVRLAWKLAARFPELVGERSLVELHEQQRIWNSDWADHYQDYLRSKGGQPDAQIDGGWPIRSSNAGQEAAA